MPNEPTDPTESTHDKPASQPTPTTRATPPSRGTSHTSSTQTTQVSPPDDALDINSQLINVPQHSDGKHRPLKALKLNKSKRFEVKSPDIATNIDTHESMKLNTDLNIKSRCDKTKRKSETKYINTNQIVSEMENKTRVNSLYNNIIYGEGMEHINAYKTPKSTNKNKKSDILKADKRKTGVKTNIKKYNLESYNNKKKTVVKPENCAKNKTFMFEADKISVSNNSKDVSKNNVGTISQSDDKKEVNNSTTLVHEAANSTIHSSRADKNDNSTIIEAQVNSNSNNTSMPITDVYSNIGDINKNSIINNHSDRSARNTNDNINKVKVLSAIRLINDLRQILTGTKFNLLLALINELKVVSLTSDTNTSSGTRSDGDSYDSEDTFSGGYADMSSSASSSADTNATDKNSVSIKKTENINNIKDTPVNIKIWDILFEIQTLIKDTGKLIDFYEFVPITDLGSVIRELCDRRHETVKLGGDSGEVGTRQNHNCEGVLGGVKIANIDDIFNYYNTAFSDTHTQLPSSVEELTPFNIPIKVSTNNNNHIVTGNIAADSDPKQTTVGKNDSQYTNITSLLNSKRCESLIKLINLYFHKRISSETILIFYYPLLNTENYEILKNVLANYIYLFKETDVLIDSSYVYDIISRKCKLNIVYGHSNNSSFIINKTKEQDELEDVEDNFFSNMIHKERLEMYKEYIMYLLSRVEELCNKSGNVFSKECAIEESQNVFENDKPTSVLNDEYVVKSEHFTEELYSCQQSSIDNQTVIAAQSSSGQIQTLLDKTDEISADKFTSGNADLLRKKRVENWKKVPILFKKTLKNISGGYKIIRFFNKLSRLFKHFKNKYSRDSSLIKIINLLNKHSDLLSSFLIEINAKLHFLTCSSDAVAIKNLFLSLQYKAVKPSSKSRYVPRDSKQEDLVCSVYRDVFRETLISYATYTKQLSKSNLSSLNKIINILYCKPQKNIKITKYELDAFFHILHCLYVFSNVRINNPSYDNIYNKITEERMYRNLSKIEFKELFNSFDKLLNVKPNFMSVNTSNSLSSNVVGNTTDKIEEELESPHISRTAKAGPDITKTNNNTEYEKLYYTTHIKYNYTSTPLLYYKIKFDYLLRNKVCNIRPTSSPTATRTETKGHSSPTASTKQYILTVEERDTIFKSCECCKINKMRVYSVVEVGGEKNTAAASNTGSAGKRSSLGRGRI
ncbi:hypothetical protein CDIK_0420 [Cucumispora dikerogammari]|nr:hypothetical protein CDIK_0420 [Cucumispora dikerogammari]